MRVLKNVRLYFIGILRIILIPAIVLLLFKVLNVSAWVEQGGFIAVICMVSSACPTAQAAGFFASKCGADGEYGSQVMAVTTLSCIITLPLIAAVSAWVLM